MNRIPLRILAFLIILNVCLELQAQECKKLEAAVFFPDMRFGKPIPASFIASCTKEPPGRSYYFVHYDSLSKTARVKYRRLFSFLALPVEHLEVKANQQNQVYGIELWTFLKNEDWKDSAHNKLLPKFTRLVQTLKLRYGKPSSETHTVPLYDWQREADGITHELNWVCNDLELRIRVTYGSTLAAMNVINIEVKIPGGDMPGVDILDHGE